MRCWPSTFHYMVIVSQQLIFAEDFCKVLHETKKKKSALLNKIRKKFGLRNRNKADSESSDDETKSDESGSQGRRCRPRPFGNKYAAKVERKVEIGWLDYDFALKSFKQVRSRKGGGTRSITVKKTSRKSDLIEFGKRYFFPNGISPKGKVEDFVFDIKDISENSLDDESTVGQIYDRTGFRILRFYMATTRRHVLGDADVADIADPGASTNDNNGSSQQPLDESPATATVTLDDTHIVAEVPLLTDEQVTIDAPAETDDVEDLTRDSDSDDVTMLTANTQEHDSGSGIVELGSIGNSFEDLDDTLSLPVDLYSPMEFPAISLQCGTRVLVIHRSKMLEDMLNAFSDPGVLNDYIESS
ncbi:uncharacterized protein [Ptychodera flava]|uniref:uncharacterized protein n=1 Tax=Ptychodera flava TaxID=63121 RepID=UPI00396A4760